MKHCDRKRGSCCWQNIENPSLCAYRNDMEEWMLCPEMLNNWEEIIDKAYDENRKMEEKINA